MKAPSSGDSPRLIDDDEALELEHRVRHKDGSYRYLDSQVVNLLDNVSLKAFVVNAWDITERREMLEALRQAKEAAEPPARPRASSSPI